MGHWSRNSQAAQAIGHALGARGRRKGWGKQGAFGHRTQPSKPLTSEEVRHQGLEPRTR